ncbi:MAG: DUF2207 domain-containing protein [Victivallales bacterium]|nr:DUF2207 domain-containing protein [Victivallales bacterium]
MKSGFALLAGLLLSGSVPCFAVAQNHSLVDTEKLVMNINRDASIDVTEVRRIAFSGPPGTMSREFLLQGCDRIEIQELQVDRDVYRRGRRHNPGEYELRILGPRLYGKGSLARRLEMRWRCPPPPQPDAGEFREIELTIKYRVFGAFGQYAAYDLLSWNPLRVYRKDFIRETVVNIVFPEAFHPRQITFRCNGIMPQQEVGPRTITFSARGLNPNDIFRFAVKFPKKIIAPYFSYNNFYYYHLKPWTLPVIIGLFAVMLLFFFLLKGRDPAVPEAKTAAIDLNFIRPGLAGLVTNESFDCYDLGVTVVDLARRGLLEIVQTVQNPPEYEIRLRRTPAPGSLQKFEQALLIEMFGNLARDSRTNTHRLEYSFYRRVPRIRQEARTDAAGWFAVSPQAARNRFLILGLAIALAGIGVASIHIPIAIFLGLWCVVFGGIPGYRMIHAIKDNGLVGLRHHLIYLPLVLLGAGVAIYSLCRAYPWSGYCFDLGIAVFIGGLLVAAAGPGMARRNQEGGTLSRRLRRLQTQLRDDPDRVTELSALDRLLWCFVLMSGDERDRETAVEVPTTEFQDFFQPLSASASGHDFTLMLRTIIAAMSPNTLRIPDQPPTSAYAD